MRTGAYSLKFPDGSLYFGSSIDMEKRLKRHRKDLRMNRHHNLKVQEKWNQYQQYEVNEMLTDGDLEQARDLEEELLMAYNGNELLLNIGRSVAGGDNLTRNPKRKVIIEKIRISLVDRFIGMTKEERQALYGRPGDRNGMYGRKHTPETIAKIKENQTILKGPDNPNYGRKCSESTRRKMSEIAKMRTGDKNPFFSRRHSDETRRKIRDARIRNPRPVGNEIRVRIWGIEYPSISAAAKALLLNPSTVLSRLKSTNRRFVHYTYIE